MKTLAIINQKGGCGKTTTAINLAASLALKGKRVLLCDLDPQGHASVGLSRGQTPEYPRTLSDALMDGGSLDGCLVRIPGGFDLAPSNPSLHLAEQHLHDLAGGETRLKDALDWVAEEYDYAILDCPPGGGVLIANALYAADEVILAVETSFYSLYGVSQLLEAVKSVKKGKETRVRALATLYDSAHRLRPGDSPGPQPVLRTLALQHGDSRQRQAEGGIELRRPHHRVRPEGPGLPGLHGPGRGGPWRGGGTPELRRDTAWIR